MRTNVMTLCVFVCIIALFTCVTEVLFPQEAKTAQETAYPVLTTSCYWSQYLTALPPYMSEITAEKLGKETDEKSRRLIYRGKMSWNFRRKIIL
jgi:hypothetical protein